MNNIIEYWNNVHKIYNLDNTPYDNWLELFSDIITQCNTPILDLGCGSGNSIIYLSSLNKDVVALDISNTAIDNIISKFPNVYDTKCIDMLNGLPFDDSSFEIVIADLCLHYFNMQDTLKIIDDIRRVLKDNGHLLVRINSINDINHGAGTGKEIEHHLYELNNGMIKRFFDEEDLKYFFKDYELEYINEEVMTRYKEKKKLYRLCLKK